MITLLENNKEFNYQIWNSDVITNHLNEIIDVAYNFIGEDHPLDYQLMPLIL